MKDDSLTLVDRSAFQNPRFGPDWLGHAKLEYASEQEREQFAAIRRSFDAATQAAEVVCTRPQEGQTPEDYARQMLGQLAPRTDKYRTLKTATIPDARLAEFAEKICADAMQAPARSGKLVPIMSRDASGRVWTEFVGVKSVWMDEHKARGWLMTAVDGVPIEQLGL